MKTFIAFELFFLILLGLCLVGLVRGEEDVLFKVQDEAINKTEEVCPEDDNGNDFIECPQTYGNTPGFETTHERKAAKKIIAGEDYSEYDKRRLFRKERVNVRSKKFSKDVGQLLRHVSGDALSP